jgi:hypothetical protein
MAPLKRVSLAVVNAGVRANVVTRQFGQVGRLRRYPPGAKPGISRLHRVGLFPKSSHCRHSEREAGKSLEFGAWWRPVSARHFVSRAISFRFRFSLTGDVL